MNQSRKMHVYDYHFIDVPWPSALWEVAFEEESNFEREKSAATKAFETAGWEGDGEVALMWIPPFTIPNDTGDGWGGFVWHVKQQNNGTSWLASKEKLPYMSDHLNYVGEY